MQSNLCQTWAAFRELPKLKNDPHACFTSHMGKIQHDNSVAAMSRVLRIGGKNISKRAGELMKVKHNELHLKL